MKILIACEFSGIVRDAFLKRGHDVMSCDLLPTESPGPHYQGDVFDIINDGWDMMIAHPPCTYLSNAGARFMYPGGVLDKKRLGKAQNGKRFFLDLFNAKIDKIAIENPVPTKIIGLPKYNQIVQPYYFGDMVQKKTCLWLKKLPPLVYTNAITGIPQSTKIPGNWFNKGGNDRQKNRSKFFPGIAQAMAEQWA